MGPGNLTTHWLVDKVRCRREISCRPLFFFPPEPSVLIISVCLVAIVKIGALVETFFRPVNRFRSAACLADVNVKSSSAHINLFVSTSHDASPACMRPLNCSEAYLFWRPFNICFSHPSCRFVRSAKTWVCTTWQDSPVSQDVFCMQQICHTYKHNIVKICQEYNSVQNPVPAAVVISVDYCITQKSLFQVSYWTQIVPGSDQTASHYLWNDMPYHEPSWYASLPHFPLAHACKETLPTFAAKETDQPHPPHATSKWRVLVVWSYNTMNCTPPIILKWQAWDPQSGMPHHAFHWTSTALHLQCLLANKPWPAKQQFCEHGQCRPAGFECQCANHCILLKYCIHIASTLKVYVHTRDPASQKTYQRNLLVFKCLQFWHRLSVAQNFLEKRLW